MIIVITHASIFLKLEGSGFQGFKMWALGFTAYQDARGCRSRSIGWLDVLTILEFPGSEKQTDMLMLWLYLEGHGGANMAPQSPACALSGYRNRTTSQQFGITFGAVGRPERVKHYQHQQN